MNCPRNGSKNNANIRVTDGREMSLFVIQQLHLPWISCSLKDQVNNGDIQHFISNNFFNFFWMPNRYVKHKCSFSGRRMRKKHILLESYDC